jgi:type II secretory pathway pseudopilin PulG
MKFTKHTGRKSGWTGLAFTLPEVLIGTAIAAFVFSGFFLCLSQGIAVTRVSRENLRAGQLLQQQMETIRLYTWSEINSNGFVPATFTVPLDPTSTNINTTAVYNGTILITNTPMTESYSNDHVMVTVSLSWTNGAVLRSRQMTTFVSKYGLHNYYY